MEFVEPKCTPCGYEDFGDFYLTHAIWRNSYGSYQPETGVRTHAAGLKDFRLIQHNSDDWPMVTVVTLAGLSKGWDAYRVGNVIEWLHSRRRAAAARKRFRTLHDETMTALAAH